MEFERIKSPSLKDLFVQQMETKILAGDLAVGSRLPSERELAEMTGVSRTVINAGIGEMTAKGFLEIKPRKGVFVADYRHRGSLATLISIMEFNGGLLPRREIKSLIQVRFAMEELCLRQVIPVIDEDGIATLEAKLADFENAKTPQEIAECRYEFGHELDCLSGNTILPLMAHSFKKPSTALWAEYSRRYGSDHLERHCAKTLEFIKQRDAEGAVEYLQANMIQALEGERQLYGDR